MLVNVDGWIVGPRRRWDRALAGRDAAEEDVIGERLTVHRIGHCLPHFHLVEWRTRVVDVEFLVAQPRHLVENRVFAILHRRNVFRRQGVDHVERACLQRRQAHGGVAHALIGHAVQVGQRLAVGPFLPVAGKLLDAEMVVLHPFDELERARPHRVLLQVGAILLDGCG